MPDLLLNATDLAWPITVALAWVVGEVGSRSTGLPRISLYGVLGFVVAQTGYLAHTESSNVVLLANIAFGLVLFEFGYRINLNWLRTNPWIGVTGLFESAGTFAAVFASAQWYGSTLMTSLLLASLMLATSPAGILNVINEQRSSGQVTERILHLTALNCVLAVFVFKVILGFWVFQSSGRLLQAVSSSLLVLLVSATLGAFFGILVPAILRALGLLAPDATIAFALTVILLVSITHTSKLSPVLATLTFGLVARHSRVALSQTQRNFGALGELLSVLLFVYVTSSLQWRHIIEGAELAMLLVLVRFVTKIFASALFARVGGISWRKGALTGMALAPISVFVVLMLEQARYLGLGLVDELAALAAVALTLDLLGPIITQRALVWAKETPVAQALPTVSTESQHGPGTLQDIRSTQSGR